MTKNTIILSLALLLGCALSAQAQNDPEDNEITVTDNDGNSEQIELPEALTHDLDSLMNLYLAKQYLNEDENCQMKDVNPFFEKEVYIDRLARIPSVIEMPYNNVVQKFMDR